MDLTAPLQCQEEIIEKALRATYGNAPVALRKFVALLQLSVASLTSESNIGGIDVRGNGIARCPIYTNGIINRPVRNIYYYINGMGWDNSSFLFLVRSLWGNGGELVPLKWLILRFSLCCDRLYAHMLRPTRPSCIETPCYKKCYNFRHGTVVVSSSK